MRELSVTEANFAGLLGSIIGVAAGIVAVILLVKDGAISGSAYLLEDFLLTSWPVLQGLGFARLFRKYRTEAARLAFLFSLVTAITRTCLALVFGIIGMPQAVASLWAALGVTLTSISAAAALTLMMVCEGIALVRTSQYARLRRLSSCAGYVCVVTGILILLPLMQGLVVVPNLLMAFLFASETGSE